MADPRLLAADALLVLHCLFVVFVIGGLVLIVTGGMRGWRWVHNPVFRISHILAIGVVVLQSWLGVVCPLTTWEMALRSGAGEATYSGSFVGHWLGRLLYYDAPGWLFVLCYSLFGALVVACWFAIPPRKAWGNSGD